MGKYRTTGRLDGGPPQLGLFSAEHSALDLTRGRTIPTADFLDEVPGNEYRIIAITLSGRLIERGAQGVVESQVQRDTDLSSQQACGSMN